MLCRCTIQFIRDCHACFRPDAYPYTPESNARNVIRLPDASTTTSWQRIRPSGLTAAEMLVVGNNHATKGSEP
jgi:hypothetical protein